MNANQMSLEQEIKRFEAELPQLLKTHPNQFVLIKEETERIFPSEKEALEYGFWQYGAGSCFLVRQIVKEQPEIRIPALTLGLL